MLVFTSLNPNKVYLDIQLKAVNSWLKLGLTVFSLNTLDEILKLQSLFPFVCFIESKEEDLFLNKENKRFIKINSIIKKSQEFSLRLEDKIICIINSDIEVLNNSTLLNTLSIKADNSCVVARRYNYEDNQSYTEIEKYGFDIFIFNIELIKDKLSKKDYSLGQPFWDYWFPYSLIKFKIPLFYFKDLLFLHKKHKKSWSVNDWLYFVEMFKKENQLTFISNKKISKFVRETIFNNSITI